VGIRGISGRHDEDNRIFDSSWEVEEWVDSLYSDFVGEGFVNVGYATPYEKVALYLTDCLPDLVTFLTKTNPFVHGLTVRTETSTTPEGTPIYKVRIISTSHLRLYLH